MQSLDKLGRDQLFYSIADKKVEEALELLNRTSNIDFQDKNGNSYLHMAVQSNLIEVVENILEKGAKVDIKDNFGKTPLMVAISRFSGDDSIIKLLLKHGADKNEKTNAGVSCLQFAEMKGIVI